MTVGGVLWLHNLGPGSLSASPRDKIDCYYEAGVYVCRLVETGTVQLKIDNVRQPRTAHPGDRQAVVPAEAVVGL